jgi:hypothetical protein
MFVANCLILPDVLAVALMVLTSTLAPEFTLKVYVPTTSPDWTIRQTLCVQSASATGLRQSQTTSGRRRARRRR